MFTYLRFTVASIRTDMDGKKINAMTHTTYTQRQWTENVGDYYRATGRV